MPEVWAPEVWAPEVWAPEVLGEPVWIERQRTHRARVDGFLRRHRRGERESHPVWDFLFRYYNLKPRQLRRWHPGYGVVLAGDRARGYLGLSGYGVVPAGDRARGYLGLSGYGVAPAGVRARGYLGSSGYGVAPAGVGVTEAHLRSRAATVTFIARLLRATAARPATLNCFGMHEWAMVYQAPTIRHNGVPLRLGADGTDAVVESMPLRCSHFDAFRFFTPAARARNAVPLTRQAQLDTEQPGCVHTAMDLYKWCYKLGPLVDSEFLMDCLELAADARELDMRASPYDLSGYGFAPIRVEEPAGRAEYVRRQRSVAERAAPLREALADRCAQLTAAVSGQLHVTAG